MLSIVFNSYTQKKHGTQHVCVHVGVGGKGDRQKWGGGRGVCSSCLCYSVAFNFNEHHRGKFLVNCVRTLRSHILNLNKL